MSEKGYGIYKIYADEVISSKNDKRLAYREVLGDAETVQLMLLCYFKWVDLLEVSLVWKYLWQS